MDAANPIQAVALIGPRNNPLYISHASSSPSTDVDLKFHYIAHSALDVIEERIAASTQQTQYLSLLFTLEDLAVYGYQTSTKIKIILMLHLSDKVIKDLDVLTIFRAVQTLYLSYISTLPIAQCSPAQSSAQYLASSRDASLGQPITSATFDRTMREIAGWAPHPVEKGPRMSVEKASIPAA